MIRLIAEPRYSRARRRALCPLKVLNCIVDMVEKTRRSVSVLRRCQESDREELNYWRRRSSEQDDPRKGGPGSAPFSKTHSPHSADSGGYRLRLLSTVVVVVSPSGVQGSTFTSCRDTPGFLL